MSSTNKDRHRIFYLASNALGADWQVFEPTGLTREMALVTAQAFVGQSDFYQKVLVRNHKYEMVWNVLEEDRPTDQDCKVASDSADIPAEAAQAIADTLAEFGVSAFRETIAAAVLEDISPGIMASAVEQEREKTVHLLNDQRQWSRRLDHTTRACTQACNQAIDDAIAVVESDK